jgi:hypothetical protein
MLGDAREIARRAGTPIVIYKNGQIVIQPVKEETFQEEQ